MALENGIDSFFRVFNAETQRRRVRRVLFSRVATFAKASASAKASADETAAEEHVERVDLWKKVKKFMAGWSATEMPR